MILLSGHRKAPPHSSTAGDPGGAQTGELQLPVHCSGASLENRMKSKGGLKPGPLCSQHDPGVQHNTSRMDEWQQASFIDVETGPEWERDLAEVSAAIKDR